MHGLGGCDGCGGCRGRTGRFDALDSRFLADDGLGLADRGRLFGFNLVADGVAAFAGQHRFVVVTQALYVKVGRHHMLAGQDQNTYAGTLFCGGKGFTLFIQQEGGNGDRHVGTDFCGAVFQRFFFNQAQYRERQ